MAGFGPMAFSPFPYGAVPSSGVASDKFVDLFNAQTAAGKKSWIVAAEAGSESIAEWGVDDSAGRFEIANGSSSGAGFSAQIKGTGSSTNIGLFGLGIVTTDSTTTLPAIVFDGRTAAGAAIVTKPILGIRNFGTTVAEVSAKGAWTYTVTKTDGSAETLATWALDEDTGSSFAIQNVTATNATFNTFLLGIGSSSNRRGVTLGGRGTTDSGTLAVVQIDGSIGSTRVGLGAATACVSRPPISFCNNNTEMAQFTAAGHLTLVNQLNLPSFTVGTVPSAATAGGLIYVSNESGGAVPAFSDNTNWRRVTDRAIVS
jgi:hypothetical protein